MLRSVIRMNLTLARCFIQVHDPDLALDFYRDALGLDATFEKLRAANAEIVQEPADQPWGARDGAVRDPSGNLVRIDQRPAPSS